ncbi:MAG: response regulator, partial [Magnetospirillum sp.]|nr:response regulator [Magnetospirillum sp.]
MSNLRSKHPDPHADRRSPWGWATALVVDDDPISRAIIARLVAQLGVGTVVEAVDGLDGVGRLEAVRPDIVILDVMMPGLDGFEVCRRIRAHADFADVPILVQTGLTAADEHLECFRAGASDVVSKPIRPPEVLARLKVHLENRRMIRDLRDAHSRMATELEGARKMQAALLPRLHLLDDIRDRTGLGIEGLVVPSSELGGDFWGVIPLDDGQVMFYTVDFSGHGVTAALNTFRLHTLIGETATGGLEPARFLGQLNQALVGLLPRGQFATMFCAIVDTRHDRLLWSSAGAPPPILATAGGPRFIDSSGVPLGLRANSTYTNRIAPFPSGARLFASRDARSEAVAGAGDRVGESGVMALFPSTAEA